MEVLRAENLYKTYGTGDNAVEALKNVSFSVKRDELVAIMGPSGSGKSTLMHIIGGVEEPTRGTVYIDDIDIYGMSREERAIFRRRNIGIVYQFYSLISVLNVEENIRLPMDLDSKKPNDERVDQILETLHLSDKKKSMPDKLSGGQQQRISIGRALINAPAIILADEPTGNLDSKNSQDIIELFKFSNKKYRQTVVIITHDEEIALQADRIIYIDDGKIVREEAVR